MDFGGFSLIESCCPMRQDPIPVCKPRGRYVAGTWHPRGYVSATWIYVEKEEVISDTLGRRLWNVAATMTSSGQIRKVGLIQTSY